MIGRAWAALADYFKEVIYGGIDGIVTTFAVVAGFAGASLASDKTVQVSFVVVILFGLANLFADAASMGLGNFLSVRSEKDLYNAKRRREQRLLKNQPDTELTQAARIMMEKGFSSEQAKSLTSIYQTNPEYFLDFMMQHKRELADPRGENEVLTGLTTFGSFLVFGSIPLLPFILQNILHNESSALVTFIYSSLGTFAALVALGVLKWRVIGSKLIPSLTEVVLVGGTAAVLAYLVGSFFDLSSLGG